MERVPNRSTRRTSGVAALFALLGLASMAAVFALPGTAMAAAPDIGASQTPNSATSHGATLYALVNPGGQTTEFHVAYDTFSSGFCQGSASPPTYSTPPTDIGFNDNTYHEISVAITGLMPGTEYCVEEYASNVDGGPVTGNNYFKTPIDPGVSTGSASAITGTSATLNGTVNPEGQSSTSYMFEYDSASSQWCQSGGATGSPGGSSPVTALGFADSTAHAVSATISFGGPGITVCFRVEASNHGGGYGGGSAVGATANFTYTAAVVRTDPATSIINGGATLNGTINSQGSQAFADYYFEYAPSSSDFCTSGGTSNTGASQAGFAHLSFMDNSDHPVSASIPGGLTPSTTYCFRLVSTSGQDGSLVTFTTGPPVTLTVHVTGEGSIASTGAGSALIDIACGGGKGAAEKANTHCSAGGLVQGTVVTLSEEPYFFEESPVPQARFAGWSGACSGTGPKCTVTMSDDMTVGATFEARSSSSPSTAAVNKALAAVLTPGGPAAKIGAILKAGSYPAAFTAPGAGTAQITWSQAPTGARISRGQKPLLVATGVKTFTKAGKATIKVKLTSKGKALLGNVKNGHKLRLNATGSFTPKGGKKTSKQKSITLKR